MNDPIHSTRATRRVARLALIALTGGLAMLAAPIAAAASLGQRFDPQPPYVGQMPTADHVVILMQSSEPLDTWARQYAAFDRLVVIITEMQAGDPAGMRDPTADEDALAATYRTARGQVESQLAASVPAGTDPADLYHQMIQRAFALEADEGFRNTVVTSLLPTEYQAAYTQAQAAAASRASIVASQMYAADTPVPSTGQTESPHIPTWIWWVGGSVLFLLFVRGQVWMHRRGLFWYRD